jgi:hypothetical protein
VSVLEAPGGGHGHGLRKRCAFLQAKCRTALKIRPDQQRHARPVLQRVHQCRRRIHLAALDAQRAGPGRNDQSADVVSLYVPRQPLKLVALDGGEAAVAVHHHQLPDFLLERHSVQRLAHPDLGLGRQFERRPGLRTPLLRMKDAWHRKRAAGRQRHFQPAGGLYSTRARVQSKPWPASACW